MPTEEEVISMLKEIVDPHTNMSVYEMGLISELRVSDNAVSLTFRPTSPFCPLGIHLAMNIKRRLKALKGTERADVKVIGHVQESQINKALAET
ncbi:MAG: metal-sulfur cluster assembly factor [Thermoplasmata archaeon]